MTLEILMIGSLSRSFEIRPSQRKTDPKRNTSAPGVVGEVVDEDHGHVLEAGRGPDHIGPRFEGPDPTGNNPRDPRSLFRNVSNEARLLVRANS